MSKETEAVLSNKDLVGLHSQANMEMSGKDKPMRRVEERQSEKQSEM